MSAIVQSARAYQASSNGGVTPSLATAPASDHLVVAVVAVDKDAGGAITAPAGFAGTTYNNTSTSGALTSATGAAPGNFSWFTARGAMFGVLETNIVGATPGVSATYPSPKNDTAVTSISGDLGAAPSNGTVFALVTIDTVYSAWTDNPSAYTPSLSNGYTLALNRMAGGNTELPGGAGYLVAKKDVLAGDSTALAVSWADSLGTAPSDQASLHMVFFAHGGVTLEGAWLGVDSVTVDTAGNVGEQVRVGFSTSSAMTSPTYTALVTPDAHGITKHARPALAADTAYWYQVERGGTLIGSPQPTRTVPGTGPNAFSFGFASCRNQNVGVGDASILADFLTRNAALFLVTGDIHYHDIVTNDQSLFRAAYDGLYPKPHIASLLKQIPTDYTWSDHDYSADNSDSTSASRPAAQAVYRERVPHPTLPSGSGGIYHTFRVGRVRFIVLDGRSYRSPSANTDGASKTLLGAEQKTWLQGLLAAPDTPLTFVVSEVPWIGAAGAGVDHWGAYATERTEIGGWITASSTRVVMLCGDAHMLAIDNGTNAVAGVHVWHAAPLNHSNSTKGGPYSGGTYTGGHGYGLVTVTDDGTALTATYSGIKADGTVWNTDTVTGTEGEPVANWYRNALRTALNKEWDWDSDDIRATLHTASYVPNLDTHDYVDDLTNELPTGNGYTAGGVALTSPTRLYTAANAWATQWAASTAYPLDRVVRPTAGNGYLYRAAVAGTSGGAQPTWPTVIGTTVVDGGVTWECVGRGIISLSAAPVVWSGGPTFGPFRYLVLSSRTPGTDATRPLIALVDYGTDKTAGGGDVTQSWNDQGILHAILP